MKRLLLLALAAVALLALAVRAAPSTPISTARASKAMPPVLGLSFRPDRTGRLAWFDALSLKTLPGRKVPLGSHLGAWSFSADRSLLAIAGGDRGRPAELRFVNARRSRLGALAADRAGRSASPRARSSAWAMKWISIAASAGPPWRAA